MKIHEISLEQIQKDLIKSQGENYANEEIFRIRFCAEERGLIYFLARENNCVPESVLWVDTDFIVSKFGKNAERLNDGHNDRMEEFKSDLKKYKGNELSEHEEAEYQRLCDLGHNNRAYRVADRTRQQIDDDVKLYYELEDKKYKHFMYNRTKDNISRGERIVCKLVF